MARWELALEIGGDVPVFLGIARAIADDVRRGRLKPGDRLPGSRPLAASLGVHRNTVLAAYAELEAEGWIRTAPQRGTFVSEALPEPRPRRFGRAGPPKLATEPGYPLGPDAVDPAVRTAPPPKGTLRLHGGLPDLRLAPVTALQRAYRRALRGAARRDLLDYGDAAGHPRLRAALAGMLEATRGLPASADELLVVRGSQMGLYLTARALLRPGDGVAVEALGYRPAWQALALAGARLHPVPVDAAGLDVAALERLCARQTIRAVYVTPHHQYPTTATLQAGRRLALLALAERRRLAIIEDDYDHEFHYEGRPVLPLASADRAGVVVYLGTMSKILAPGLRIGYVVAPRPVVARLAALRVCIDRQGDQAVEVAVATLIEDGELQRHVSRGRRLYRARRDALVEALGRELGGVVEAAPPPGGMAIWARAAVDVDAWAERALAAGVSLQTGRRFAFDGRSRPYLRLGFAALDEAELGEAVRRMRRALC